MITSQFRLRELKTCKSLNDTTLCLNGRVNAFVGGSLSNQSLLNLKNMLRVITVAFCESQSWM
jgi:hypothetical protein